MVTFKVNESNRFLNSSTSKGNQIKWITYDKGKKVYLKADTMGYEGIAEAIAHEFINYVEGIESVDYSLCIIEEDGVKRYGCYSYDMLKDGESLISIYRLLTLKSAVLAKSISKLSGKDLLLTVVDEVKRFTGCDIYNYLHTMLSIDAIILNEDRHLNNISLVEDRSGFYHPSILFDHGLSLLSDTDAYISNTESTMRKVKSKPFSASFKKQVGYFDLPPIKIRTNEFLNHIKICGVDFKQRDFVRAKSVLIRMLKSTEGQIWVQS